MQLSTRVGKNNGVALGTKRKREHAADSKMTAKRKRLPPKAKEEDGEKGK